MVLKFKNSDGNWEFKDGEICYRYIPFSDVLDSYLDDNGLCCTEDEARDKTRENICNMYEKLIVRQKEDKQSPSFWGVVKQYIAKHFWRAEEGIFEIDLGNLTTQNERDLYGIYIIEVNREESEPLYIVANKFEGYILTDTGKTIEKLYVLEK